MNVLAALAYCRKAIGGAFGTTMLIIGADGYPAHSLSAGQWHYAIAAGIGVGLGVYNLGNGTGPGTPTGSPITVHYGGSTLTGAAAASAVKSTGPTK